MSAGWLPQRPDLGRVRSLIDENLSPKLLFLLGQAFKDTLCVRMTLFAARRLKFI